MTRRLRILSIGIALIGIGFIAAGGFAYMKTQEGYRSLNAFSAAQHVTLTYNEQGQLVDGDDVNEAQAILALLKSDWGFPVVDSKLNPNDPVINTATEYMYQMAMVTYHTLHATTTVVVPETVEYNGEVFQAGEYEFVNDGRYWVDFDRMHPIEGPARAQIWSPTAHRTDRRARRWNRDGIGPAAGAGDRGALRGRRHSLPGHRRRGPVGDTSGNGTGACSSPAAGRSHGLTAMTSRVT